jgi:hypothetical protein
LIAARRSAAQPHVAGGAEWRVEIAIQMLYDVFLLLAGDADLFRAFAFDLWSPFPET